MWSVAPPVSHVGPRSRVNAPLIDSGLRLSSQVTARAKDCPGSQDYHRTTTGTKFALRIKVDQSHILGIYYVISNGRQRK